jgi:hypothetical protein
MKGLLDECGAAVRSVDRVTLLPPAELDSAAAATLPTYRPRPYPTAIPCLLVTLHAQPRWTSLEIIPRLYRLGYPVVKSDVPNAPPDPVSDKYFVSSGISSVHQPEEVDASYSIPTTRLSTTSILT